MKKRRRPVVSGEDSSTPLSLPGASSLPLGSPLAALAHLPGTAVALFTAYKAAAWLPTTLEILKTPDGGVSHDPWTWAPFVLCLATLVAVAAPVSFRSVVDFVTAVLSRRQQQQQ